MCLPCNLYDETDSHAGIFVCAAECIDYEQSLVGELFLGDFLNSFPCLFASRMVVVFVLVGGPPNGVLGVLVHNNIFVFR